MRSLLYTFLIVLLPLSAFAQEEANMYIKGKTYIKLRSDRLEKLSYSVKNRQQRLLKTLRKKEARFLSKLQKNDSAAFVHLDSQPISFDSISRLQKPDSATLAKKNRGKQNKTLDSLKAVQTFIGKQSNSLGFSDPTNVNSSQLNSLQNELNYRKYVDDLIGKRTQSLKSTATTSKISGFTSLEKKAFYAKQKMQALKDISEEPTKSEERILEYLQGTEGFDAAMDQAGVGSKSVNGMTSGSSVADLKKIGFQTKYQVQQDLKAKFGGNVEGVTQKMGGQIKDFQNKGQAIKDKVKNGKGTISDVKKATNNVKSIEKPSFHVNPMREKLFWQRIEKQYNFQTTRASASTPALLEASALAGFKHTPSLTYGVGIASSIGLGQGWSKIKLSLEGVGVRSFARWEWRYGLGAYAGYERMFKISNTQTINPVQEGLSASVHNTNRYSERVLIGLTKSYNINPKYNGAIQLLYDIWWKEKGLRSPFVLRFSTQSK